MTAMGTDSDAERRWDAAAQLAAGVDDNDLKRRRVRVLLWVGALLIGSWVLGVVLALLLPQSVAGRSGEPSVERLIGQSAFLGLGLLIGIVGFVWGIRTGHYITRWKSAISPLNSVEKRSVRRQIRGKEPIDAGHAATVLAIAEQSRRGILGLAPIYAAIMLIAIATAIASDSLAITLIELFVSVLFAVVAVQLAVVYRSIGAVIRRNKPSTP